MNVTFLIIRKILPFVKEMIFGKGKISQIIRYDRRRFYFFLLIVTSFILNVFAVPAYINDIAEELDPDPKPELRCTAADMVPDYSRKQYLENQFKEFIP